MRVEQKQRKLANTLGHLKGQEVIMKVYEKGNLLKEATGKFGMVIFPSKDQIILAVEETGTDKNLSVKMARDDLKKIKNRNTYFLLHIDDGIKQLDIILSKKKAGS